MTETMAALLNINWNIREDDLSQARLIREDPTRDDLPILPETMTLEEYLLAPLNLTTNDQGQIILVFPQIAMFKGLSAGGRRISTPLEVVYTPDQLSDGLHVLGALHDFAQSIVSLDILRKYDSGHNADPEGTYEDLAKKILYHRPDQPVRYQELLWPNTTFYGLVLDDKPVRSNSGYYQVLLN